jgi:hypothetical protein
LAFAMPHSSGQQMAAWSPAATPRRVWPSTITARRPATETSASRATTSPAPTAGPTMADTMGVEQSSTCITRSRASRMTRARAAGSPAISWIIWKLPPEEKASPAPRTTTTRVSGSRSTTGQTSARSWCMAASTELRPGASSVIRRIPGSGRSNARVGKAA